MQSMTKFDVVLVPFPFSDLRSSKKRPCLILTMFEPKSLGKHMIVSMITSNLAGISFPFDIVMKDWKGAGLPKPSLIRLSKIVTLDSTIVVKNLGRITGADQDSVAQNFAKLFKSLV